MCREQELLAGINTKTGMNLLLSEYTPFVRYLASKLSQDFALREDLVQIGLIKIWERVSAEDLRGVIRYSLAAMLSKSITWGMQDYIREYMGRKALIHEEYDDNEHAYTALSIEESIYRDNQISEFLQKISSLSEIEKEVLVRMIFDDDSAIAIAKEKGMNGSTLYAVFKRALKKTGLEEYKIGRGRASADVCGRRNRAKLTVSIVKTIKEQYSNKVSITAIANSLGLNRGSVRDVCSNRTWRHV